MRIYNPRLGRFLSTDPLFKSYAGLTPYQFASNTPIGSIDLDGEESRVVIHYGQPNEEDVTIVKNYRDIGGQAQGYRGGGTLHMFIDLKTKKQESIYLADSYAELHPIANYFETLIKTGKSPNQWEGHSDPANTGQTTKKDMAVGLGVIGVITGVGAIAEAVTAVGIYGAGVEAIATLNSLDDALGGFTKGDGSALEDLSKGDLQKTISQIKGITAMLTSIKGGKNLSEEGKEALNKTFSTLQVIGDAVNAALKAKEAKEEKAKESKKESKKEKK